MKKLLAILAVLLPISAAAQSQYPSQLQPNSLYGRVGINPGPGQSIPFSSALGYIVGPQSPNFVFAGPSSGSSVATPTFRLLVGADLPNPSSSTLGGTESLAVVAHQFMTGISTAGVPSQAQPAFTDISGIATGAQLPLPTTSTLGGLESITCASHQWINTIPTTQVQPTCSQPASSDISGNLVTSLTPAGGIVSSNTASCSQSAITSTGTIYKAECVNAQTGTSYAIADGDRAKLITASNSAAQAYTIAQAGAASAFQAGWYTDIQNNSSNVAGIVTITATTSTFSTTGTTTLTIQPGQFARIVSDGTNYQVFARPQANQLPGTATNDNANAGNVGEYIESVVATGSAVSLVSATNKDVTTLTLTAGDWDVAGNISFNSSGSPSVTGALAGISATANTMDFTNGRISGNFFPATSGATVNMMNVSIQPVRFSISASTTYHLVAQATFSAGTLTAYGIIRARRIR